MTTGSAGMAGHRPKVTITYGNPEREKYQKMWARKEYRQVAPGEHHAHNFLDVVKPEPDSTVIDFGCGTGRGSVMLAMFGQCNVQMVDFAPNCIDEQMQKIIEVQDRLSFMEHDLTKPLTIKAPYGYCTDVMEHIPEKDVQEVLTNIFNSAKKVYFNISTVPDKCGELIGEKLHMTVKPAQWWLDQFTELDCLLHYVQAGDGFINICATAWMTFDDLHEHLGVNVPTDELISHVKQNVQAGYDQVTPHELHDNEMMLVLGGPSLNDFTDEIIEKRKSGMPLVVVNGTYEWALKHGMKPSAMVMVDGREFNKRFITEPVDTCKYLINSQCHPETLARIPPDQVLLWHSKSHSELKEVLDEHYDVWHPIPGGCTVGLRALVLMRFLGWKHMHVYGFDSCLSGDQHHAYSQPENDNEVLVTVESNGKRFECSQWMAMQADEFRQMVDFFGDELQLAIYGDGLIANILKDASTLEVA